MPRTYDHQWQRVRLKVLDRDGRRCRIQGPKCTGEATEVDHIVPVEAGGARLSLENLRASCRACNRGRAARSKNREGWRRSSTHIVLVVGPAGAGKSTLVSERAESSDVVVDYDVLAQALGSSGHGSEDQAVTKAARNAVLKRVQRGEVNAPRVWLVSANPNAEQMFPHHEVVVVDPGRDEAVRRGRSAGRPARWESLVDEWYRQRHAEVSVVPSREW